MNVTVWYIYAKGCPKTNELLAGHSMVIEECSAKRCKDGQSRDLWKCKGALISELENYRDKGELKYKIFVQDGPNGLPYPWALRELRKSKKMKPKKKWVQIG